MHGNVKGQNDLVIAQGAKIADFGCALRVVADEIPSHVSEEEKDFLEKYYKRDPSKKGLVEELLVHEFVHAFNEHIDYELKLSSFEPLIYILPWVCWRWNRTLYTDSNIRLLSSFEKSN
ncbi:hypothetical protein HN51_063526 [Arachis hypogaea]